ncbi:MAG: hypothetical protein V1650_04220 [Candidatus Omnitrophota bacterium]
MTKFEALFGIKAHEVKRNCILMPMLPKGIINDFKISKLNRGRIYGAGNSENLTLIHTLIGPAFTGDAVLWLKETKCENIILFGSCGGVRETKDLTIGSLVVPVKCYANESFTEFLGRGLSLKIASSPAAPRNDTAKRLGRARNDTASLRENLVGGLVKITGARKVICASIPSLKLEESMTGLFIKNKIDVVDMECSACFSAAKYTGLRAAALFYVSDVINKYSFYRELDVDKKERLASAIKTAATLLCKLTKTNFSA